ncbi:MAG: Hsp20/alpha crystallin family protein [Planctomycetota bacterium]|nr:Hsp20/alpha crystallin family protein [Planctomycetota bacterium]
MSYRIDLLGFPFLERGVSRGPWQPAADVYRTQDGWLVKFDLAGVKTEDVTVRAAGHALIVSGVRRDMQTGQGLTAYLVEIAYSRFERRIEFPDDLDRACLTATFCNGMLVVRLRTRS